MSKFKSWSSYIHAAALLWFSSALTPTRQLQARKANARQEQGRRLVWRRQHLFTGTHEGPWLGRRPNGQEITGTAFSFFDLVDGRINRYRVWFHAVLDVPIVFDSSRPDIPRR